MIFINIGPVAVWKLHFLLMVRMFQSARIAQRSSHWDERLSINVHHKQDELLLNNISKKRKVSFLWTESPKKRQEVA